MGVEGRTSELDVSENASKAQQICETSFQHSKWMNGKCFSFHAEEVKSFREAHKTCHDTFLKFGFQNGKMYEPRDLIEFEEVYKMAEDFSKKQTLTIWLGINDIES